MLFTSGETRCISCGNILDSADDIFVVSEFIKQETILEPKAGFYHYDCFYKLNSMSTYLSLEESRFKKEMRDSENPMEIMGSDDDYCLGLFPHDKSYRLYFIKKAREIRFPSIQNWHEFKHFVLDRDIKIGKGFYPNFKKNGVKHLYQLNITYRDVDLYAKEMIEKEVEVTMLDYRRILEKLGEKNSLVNHHIDCASLFSENNIIPIDVDGLLIKCKGEVIKTENIDSNVIIYLNVDKWIRVHFSLIEFRKLKMFLRNIKFDEPNISPDKLS